MRDPSEHARDGHRHRLATDRRKRRLSADPLAAASEALLDRRQPIDEKLAHEIARLSDARLPELVALAHRVRLDYVGPSVELEAIISGKTGGCPEDCHFCSQSGQFETTVRPEPLVPIPELLEAAREAEKVGAGDFCIVLALRGPDRRVMDWTLEAVAAVRAETKLNVNCSLGLLTPEQARELASAGVRRYNHNLETARSFFPKVCTTHSWEDRAQTCHEIKAAGMQLCSGGIIGMGETLAQRVEFAMQLQQIAPDEVPINFLHPRPGTPMEDLGLVAPMEALRFIALFRLALPGATLRYAGGREVTLKDLQATGMLAGVNGLIIGNYLTTLGRNAADDLAMLADLGMPVKHLL